MCIRDSSQTDLPLLVVADTGRFLRGHDVYSGGLEDQFYWWTEGAGLTKAPRGTLFVGDDAPLLDGSWTATLADGTEVEVTTVWEMLRRRLEDYTPELASQVCGVHPEVTVSYTHLRAHETVLDLVCRLLLVKKKHEATHTI